MFRCVMQAGPHWSKNFTSSLFPDDSLQQTRFILQEKGISEKIIHSREKRYKQKQQILPHGQATKLQLLQMQEVQMSRKI